MKPNISKTMGLFAAFTILANVIYAQAPNLLNYQSVVRNSGGQPIPGQAIGIRFTIIDSSGGTGTVVYQETQTITTNALGMLIAAVGAGTPVSGTIAGVNWGSHSKYLKVEIDPTGGTSYALMGTNQLLSVPYALSSGQWASNGNNIYNVNSGYVGIGTASPLYPLEVDASTNHAGRFKSTAGGNDINLMFSTPGGDIGAVGYAAFDSSMSLFTYGNANIALGTNNLNNVMLFLQGSTNFVGIGTSTPSHAVDISGADLAVGGALNVANLWLRNTSDSAALSYDGTYVSLTDQGNGWDFNTISNYFEPFGNNVTSLGDAS